MADINPTRSIILNLNSVTVALKDRNHEIRWKNKAQPCAVCQETHLKHDEIIGLKIKGYKKVYHTNTNRNKS